MADPSILWYYGSFDEGTRLTVGEGKLELARIREILTRFLPAPPARVLDVGGATGVYSTWLGSQGYVTHLVDPVPRHVEAARRQSEIASAREGDARELSETDASFDVVLLMGPLYHLPESAGRLKALREAWRVLKPGGLLAATAINRYSPFFECLRHDLLFNPQFVDIVEEDLRTGRHRNETQDLFWFTTAYLHRADQLQREIASAQFAVLTLAAVQGPFWMFPAFEEWWADETKRAVLLRLARKLEREPEALSTTCHLLAMARKPPEA
jgi:SAM-dependent methyltransferase